MPDSQRSMSRKRQILIPLLLVIIAATIMALLYKARPQAPEGEAAEKVWPVLATTLEARPRSPQLRLLGRVETPFQSTLSAAVTADVASLPVLEGERVNKGDVIVRLDDSEVGLLVDQREADLAELQSQIAQERNQFASDRQLLQREENLVAIARRALEREQRLADSNMTSKARTDETRQALETARISHMNRELAVGNHDSRMKSLQARLNRAEALLKQARLDLNRTTAKAPFDGVVTEIAVSPGERVRPGEMLASLYATNELEVRAQIPMKQVSAIQKTLAANRTVTAQTGDDAFELKLDRLSGQVNAGAGGVDGLFRFSGEVPDTALNRTLDITLELPVRERLFAVPVSALYDERTLYQIIDGHLQPVEVEVVGSRYEQNRQMLLIRSAQLSDGDRILETQLPNAISGLSVEVRTASGETQQPGESPQSDPSQQPDDQQHQAVEAETADKPTAPSAGQTPEPEA